MATLEEKNRALAEALKALGAKPKGYCFCATQEQVAAGHTGECLDACAALDLNERKNAGQ